MTRLVICFDAALQAIAAVSHARKTEDVGKSAAAFLTWLTDEAALQLAMLADASDQVMLLVRSNGVEAPDPSQHGGICLHLPLGGCPTLAGRALLDLRLHS